MTIGVGGEYAKLRFRNGRPGERREWTRGKVTAFSPRSRSRLLQSFAKADLRGYESRVLFVTLTYHHEWGEIGLDWKADLKEYERRIRRKHPGAWMYWRLELQKRGAPHFHCLVFGLDESAKPLLRQTWLDVAEACCEWCHLYMARVDKLKTWEQVRCYVSKYCAKVEDIEPRDPGRYWGILNRAQRTERLLSVEVTEDEAFRIRRIFKRLIRAANGYHKPGGSRSGVWVRCSNETAKRALTYAMSAHRPPEDGDDIRTAVQRAAVDTLSLGTDCYSTDGWGAGRATRFARSTGSANVPAFDSADLAAAWARGWLA